MKPSDAPTVKAKRSPVIIVVGFDATFVRRCSHMAAAEQATVVGIEPGGESAFVMQTLPIAVVIQNNQVAASPLGPIARELGIELIVLPDGAVSDTQLQQRIAAAVAASHCRTRTLR